MFRLDATRRASDPRLLALLSGLAMAMAFPGHPDRPLAWLYGSAWAWVALAPLLLALRRGAGARVAFRLGWSAGFVFHILSLYWIGHTQGGGAAVVVGALLGAAYLSLFTGLFAAGLHILWRRFGDIALLGAPFLWVAVEYLLSLGELGFPWMLLGHSQAATPLLIQYAAVTGVYGVSFAAALAGALLALALTRRDHRRAGLAAAAIAVPAAAGLYGWAIVAPEAGDGLRVAVVQNDVGLEKWRPGGLEASLAGLAAASRGSLDQEPDLVVWPEMAVPCNLGWRPDCRAMVRRIVADLDRPVLTGGSDTDRVTGEPYNAAFLFQPHRPDVPSYAKMHLVPFGERTPLRDSVPFLRHLDWSALTGDLGPAEFARGTRRTLFSVARHRARTPPSPVRSPVPAAANDPARFAVLICFESIFPDLVRTAVAAGADFLVVITNDSWFGPTAGPFQHAAIAVLRAVENRTAVVRCATNGVSLFIDRFGRARLRTDLGTAAVRVGEVALRTGTTFYTRHGDLFAQTCLTLSLVALLATPFTYRTRHA